MVPQELMRELGADDEDDEDDDEVMTQLFTSSAYDKLTKHVLSQYK